MYLQLFFRGVIKYDQFLIVKLRDVKIAAKSGSISDKSVFSKKNVRLRLMSKRLMSRMEGNCFETGTNSGLSTAFFNIYSTTPTQRLVLCMLKIFKTKNF